ncbi:MAG: ribosome silencing factor [Microthrixaceae bacterium]|nr:ribosome silencing factor [Microthrixaceae bacterium]HPB44957.1 ribosome silencing factor [Microthrixaceae bacterium]
MTLEDPTADPIRSMAVAAARAADNKVASDIVVLEVGPIVSIYEYLVIASATNPRQVAAVAQEIEDVLALEFDRRPNSVEGRDTGRWILADYGDIVVHVFHTDERDFYRLERLFGDAARVDWQPAPIGLGDPA